MNDATIPHHDADAPGVPADARPMDAWVPHRGAMSLLDRVEAADEDGVVAWVTVPADGLFATAEGVPAWVGIEYMAQAVAAWSGARARDGGGSPRIGFLLGSRRYEARESVFAAGAQLRVSARCELIGANGLGMFDCRIEHAGRELATARLSVYEPPEGADSTPGATQEPGANDKG
jgi:predicted hotdog family 3-hydroxylacyl-ACP dehydratase